MNMSQLGNKIYNETREIVFSLNPDIITLSNFDIEELDYLMDKIETDIEKEYRDEKLYESGMDYYINEIYGRYMNMSVFKFISNPLDVVSIGKKNRKELLEIVTDITYCSMYAIKLDEVSRKYQGPNHKLALAIITFLSNFYRNALNKVDYITDIIPTNRSVIDGKYQVARFIAMTFNTYITLVNIFSKYVKENDIVINDTIYEILRNNFMRINPSEYKKLSTILVNDYNLLLEDQKKIFLSLYSLFIPFAVTEDKNILLIDGFIYNGTSDYYIEFFSNVAKILCR